MELITAGSNRGKDQITIDSFKFRKAHVAKNGRTRWRCTVNSCKAKIYTDGKSDIVVETVDIHTHEKDERSLEKQIVRGVCKRRACEDLNEKPAKVIRKEILHSSVDSKLVYQDTLLIRQAMYRARRSLLPPLPKSRNDVHQILKTMAVKTNRDEGFLLINDEDNGIVVFSCSSNLRFLCNLNRIYVDGTFAYCTKFFKQLFIIHGLQNGHYIPLVFCLLPTKSENCYTRMFAFVKEKCLELGLHFHPTFLVADFEIGIHNSARAIWQDLMIVGCRFHLSQAWYRQIQKLGLANMYKDSKSEIGKWLTHVFGLPFLEPTEVGDCFALDLYEEIPTDFRVQQFADYLVDNYIGEAAPFPPQLWAEATESTQNSTNACESFHSRFNASFYSPHPPLFKFCETLLDFQIDTYLKIRGSDIPALIRDRSVRKRQAMLADQLHKYRNESISRFQFVKNVSFHFRAKRL